MIFVCVRSHLAQAWYPAGKLIYIFHFEIRSSLVGDCKKVKQISVADLIASTISRVQNNESISDQYLI